LNDDVWQGRVLLQSAQAAYQLFIGDAGLSYAMDSFTRVGYLLNSRTVVMEISNHWTHLKKLIRN